MAARSSTAHSAKCACARLGLAAASYYYQAVSESAENLFFQRGFSSMSAFQCNCATRCLTMRFSTTQRMGWAGMANGDLLVLAEGAGFEVFIVADKNLRYQQNLSSRSIAILELWTNHRPTLEKHFDEIRAAVQHIGPAEYITMHAP